MFNKLRSTGHRDQQCSRYQATGTIHGRKVRITMVHDRSYHSQSSATAELWNAAGTKWVKVANQPWWDWAEFTGEAGSTWWTEGMEAAEADLVLQVKWLLTK